MGYTGSGYIVIKYNGMAEDACIVRDDDGWNMVFGRKENAELWSDKNLINWSYRIVELNELSIYVEERYGVEYEQYE